MTTKYLFDFERVGFKINEIMPILEKHGINIDSSSDMPESKNKDVALPFPEWKKTMSLLPFLTHKEATAALANIDIYAPYYLSDHERAELSRWELVIIRSITTGELKAKETKWGDIDIDFGGEASEWSIKPTDLMEWCNTKGIPYPLPSNTTLPQTDKSLRDALSECDKERLQLKAKVAELEANITQVNTLQVEVNRLRAELSSKTDELDGNILELNKLREDKLAGKTISSLLKIIGVLAMEYGIDIHATQIKGISDLVKIFQIYGVDVDPKTLSERFKEAANHIDKKKPKT